jgi:hypothetical protein
MRCSAALPANQGAQTRALRALQARVRDGPGAPRLHSTRRPLTAGFTPSSRSVRVQPPHAGTRADARTKQDVRQHACASRTACHGIHRSRLSIRPVNSSTPRSKRRVRRGHSHEPLSVSILLHEMRWQAALDARARTMGRGDGHPRRDRRSLARRGGPAAARGASNMASRAWGASLRARQAARAGRCGSSQLGGRDY